MIFFFVLKGKVVFNFKLLLRLFSKFFLWVVIVGIFRIYLVGFFGIFFFFIVLEEGVRGSEMSKSKVIIEMGKCVCFGKFVYL